MDELATFQEAIDGTDQENLTLLIGSGFSYKYFAYRNLLNASGIDENDPINSVFDLLQTVDFEKVIKSLEDSSLIEKAYDNEERSVELHNDAERVRNALVHAVNETHPQHRDELDYGASINFLENFAQIFTLNYDLLLYWSILNIGNMNDGFGLGATNGALLGPFKEEAYCNVYNIHGGLHIFHDEKDDTVSKVINTGNGVMSNVQDAILVEKRLPLYVAEGASTSKMIKINSISYLRHCYNQLEKNENPIFIFGHSANETDEHIYQAIFNSPAKEIHFGIYDSSDQEFRKIEGQLAKYSKMFGKGKKFYFYDSSTVDIWQ